MKTNMITEKHLAAPADRFGLLKVARRIRRFHRAKRGVAAIEFALIAPFMIALWLGSMELSQAVTIDRKVSLASSALADLITQQTNLTGAEMADIMNATTAIMMPYDVDRLSIEIAGVDIDGNGNISERWTESRTGASAGGGGGYTIPPALIMPNSFLVVAQLSYSHTPVTTRALSGPITLTDEFFLRPRRSDDIDYNP